jgi:ribosomal 50S subunit-recycling heat shock protein
MEMRLDSYLKAVGIIKRRSVAKEICEQGVVRINGHPAKSGKSVRAGNRIEMDFYNRFLSIEVIKIPTGMVPKKEREGYYKVLDDRRKPEDE